MTRSRLVVLLAVVLLACVAYAGWVAWQVRNDLTVARGSIAELSQSIDDGDRAARQGAVRDLQESAASADDHTSGVAWSVGTRLPWVGDDLRGVRALASALRIISEDGLDSLLPVIDGADRLVRDGQVDLDRVAAAQEPLAKAAEAFTRAEEETDGVDSSGFVGILGTRYLQVSSQVKSAAAGLRGAATTAEVLPAMTGSEGPRDYLLIFQNNAEIRATGGLPGSWALIHAEDGRLSLREQGTALDFPRAEEPVLPLLAAEEAVYGEEIGTYFQDPGFAPDFPRAAELWNAHWERKSPDTPLDGVLAIDPVALSYLLEGTGPLTVEGRTLTAANLVDTLLNQAYVELEPEEQDSLFAESTRVIFDAVTTTPKAPLKFVQGLQRAAQEGRFLVAPFTEDEQERLQGTAVEGALAGSDGEVPHVDVGLNDSTASKMSYYLRYNAVVESVGCVDSRQQLSGTMTLRQAITPADAALLPDSVTGAAPFGPEPGQQQVAVRLYGPVDGSISDITLDGKAVAGQLPVFTTESGRSVVSLSVLPDSRDDITLSWSMTTGRGQTADGEVGVTPGVLPGDASSEFRSAC